MRMFARPIAVITLALLVSECSAEKPETRQKERDAAAQQGKRGPAGQRSGRTGQRDSVQMVARMIREFDQDGDRKLDEKELAALFASMRERREGGQRMRPGGRAGAQRKGKPGAERKGRRPDAENAGNPGGQRPKRPQG